MTVTVGVSIDGRRINSRAIAVKPDASAQIKAQLPAGITPAWEHGIQPISRDSYWNAVDCGKQGGANPPCVFYDTGLCKNNDFTLALYTPYKMVAYEVWQAVKQHSWFYWFFGAITVINGLVSILRSMAAKEAAK